MIGVAIAPADPSPRGTGRTLSAQPAGSPTASMPARS